MNFAENSELIDSLKKGDEKAYMFLVDKYHRRLHAYALSLAGDYTMAQDIVQNVFLKAWRYRKKLNPKFSLQSFLYKSVYNEFVNEYQKNQTILGIQQKYEESLSEVVEETDEVNWEKIIVLVNAEIKNLPKKCQKVFVLSKIEGLTNIEISEYLNISVKTVEAQITKAFKILKNSLGDKLETFLFLLFGIPGTEIRAVPVSYKLS